MLRACLPLLVTMYCYLSAQAQSHTAQEIPTFLVNSNTKQFYRFHFSGLQAENAMKLAQQLSPIAVKLPADNPVRQAILGARDRDSFADDYRTLRACFLEQGIDSLYFQVEQHWIDSVTLPGYLILPGTLQSIQKLKARLELAGLRTWASYLQGFEPAKAKGWMVRKLGNIPSGAPAPNKAKLIEHSLRTRCPIRPASVQQRVLPQVAIQLADTHPVTLVNLERNRLDSVMGVILPALAPSLARTVELSDKALASSFVVAVNPMPYVMQVAHMPGAKEAQELGQELQRSINAMMDRMSNSDDDLDQIVKLFVKSTVAIDVRDRDVLMMMKPPVLFDMEAARRESKATQEQDWTALPAPSGMHWELVGTLGTPLRYDLMQRVAQVSIKGQSSKTRLTGKTVSFAGLTWNRDKRGGFTITADGKSVLPAMEFFDDANRLVGVLRLDLKPGDGRFDLARSRAILQRRVDEWKKGEQQASKAVDSLKNEWEKQKLESPGKIDANRDMDMNTKVQSLERIVSRQQAGRLLTLDWERKIAEMQAKFPAATLARDGELLTLTGSSRAERPSDARFAGYWLFDYGVLTLYQNEKGTVIGTFSSKAFRSSLGALPIDGSRGTAVTAVLAGQARNNTLSFTLHDARGRERSGKLELGEDGLSGKWALDAFSGEVVPRTASNSPRKEAAKSQGKTTLGKTGSGFGGFGKTAGKANDKTKDNPFRVNNPGMGLGMNPLARRQELEKEQARTGKLERLDFGFVDPNWFQQGDGSDFAGYWVHDRDKSRNTLIKKTSTVSIFQCSGAGTSMMPNMSSSLKGVGIGNLLFLLPPFPEQFGMNSIQALTLAEDKQSVTLYPEAIPTAPVDMLRSRNTQKGMTLKRDDK